MLKPFLIRGVLILAVSSFVIGCSAQQEESQNQNQNISQWAQIRADNNIAPRLPTRSFEDLVTVAGKPILPKWKTKAECKAEQLYKMGKTTGAVNLDGYDDYRKYYASKFHITQPPTSSVRIPGEYEPSQAYLLGWNGTWLNSYFLEIIHALWGTAPVILPYSSSMQKNSLMTILTSAGIDPNDSSKIIWWSANTDSVWARDFGPLGIVNTQSTKKISFVDFKYYQTRVSDDKLPSDLAADWGINIFRPDLSFEGGNFMSTGDGFCAASRAVLIRNPHLTQSTIESIFKDYLGCTKNLFLESLSGEQTGHIDMFAKLGSDTAVMIGKYTSTQDPDNKAILDANAAWFASSSNGAGKSFIVTRIPMPNKGLAQGFFTIWRTYTNSLALSNGTQKVVVIPVYSDETSKEAAALVAYNTVFPGWTQVKVDSKDIIISGGSIHCVTMQISVGQKSKMETNPASLCGTTSLSCYLSTGCGSVPSAGCCDGELVKYCDNYGELSVVDCYAKPHCGWEWSNSWYDCGTAGNADPGGTPKNCTSLPIYTDSSDSPEKSDRALAPYNRINERDHGWLSHNREFSPEAENNSESEGGCNISSIHYDSSISLLALSIVLLMLLGRR